MKKQAASTPSWHFWSTAWFFFPGGRLHNSSDTRASDRTKLVPQEKHILNENNLFTPIDII